MEKKVGGNFSGNTEAVLVSKVEKNQIFANAVDVDINAQS